MSKVCIAPYEALFAVPVVLVSCMDENGRANIITLAWAGVISSSPPSISISIRPTRHSFGIIKKTKEFVVNIPDEKHLAQVDYCGVVSGRDVDKFKQTNFTAVSANKIKSPLIKECPVNIECKVRNIVNAGSHHAFIGEVVNVNADKDIVDSLGAIDHSKVKPIVYVHGEYWSLNKKIGIYGLSRKRAKKC